MTGEAPEREHKAPVRFDRGGRRYITDEDVKRSPVWRAKIKWLAEHGDLLLSTPSDKRCPTCGSTGGRRHEGRGREPSP